MPLLFPFGASYVIRGAGLQSCGRRPRRPLRARIWLVPLREERVLEDPRRPGGLPHNCRSLVPVLEKRVALTFCPSPFRYSFWFFLPVSRARWNAASKSVDRSAV